MAKAVKGIRFDCIIVDETTGVVFKQEENAKIILNDGTVIVGKITDIEYNDCIHIYCKSLERNLEIEDYNITSIERVV